MLMFLNFHQINNRSRKQVDSTLGNHIPELHTQPDLAKVERTVSGNLSEQIGRVKFQGVSWQAACDQGLSHKPGTLVRVLYRNGNTLIVATPLPAVSAQAT